MKKTILTSAFALLLVLGIQTLTVDTGYANGSGNGHLVWVYSNAPNSPGFFCCNSQGIYGSFTTGPDGTVRISVPTTGDYVFCVSGTGGGVASKYISQNDEVGCKNGVSCPECSN